MSSFQRARKPEHKLERQSAVLEAAARLSDAQDPALLSLSEIARHSKVSKPNVYRYFESREEILLRLFVQDLHSFVNEVEGVLEENAGLEQVARLLTGAYAARPRLCRFLGLVSGTLEHNVSEEVIIQSKREMLALSARLSQALHRALPGVPPEGLSWAVGMLAVFVGGLWPASHPAPPAERVLEDAEFAALRTNFRRDLERMILSVLRGLAADGAGLHHSTLC